MAQSVFNGSILGAAGNPIWRTMRISAISNYAMAALNAGFCARFPALNTKDIKSIRLYWGTVTAAGVVEARIETIDTATGKPTGSLYDAAATKSFTPTAGAQTVTFDTLPTTGLTEGTYYALVLLTTTGGTAMTLRSHVQIGGNGPAMLKADDGTTRTNFAVVPPATTTNFFIFFY